MLRRPLTPPKPRRTRLAELVIGVGVAFALVVPAAAWFDQWSDHRAQLVEHRADRNARCIAEQDRQAADAHPELTQSCQVGSVPNP